MQRCGLKLKGRSVDITWAVPKNKNGCTDVNQKDVTLICTPTLGLSENDLLRYFEARHKIQYSRIEGITLKNDSAEIKDGFMLKKIVKMCRALTDDDLVYCK